MLGSFRMVSSQVHTSVSVRFSAAWFQLLYYGKIPVPHKAYDHFFAESGNVSISAPSRKRTTTLLSLYTVMTSHTEKNILPSNSVSSPSCRLKLSIIELQGADLQDQFSVLKSEMYAGVRNTAMKRYDDGFERMLNVMERAIATSVNQYILSRSPYWINNRIKQGVCHFLVNDGKLRWVKRNG